jgi:hypothetical protein
VVGTCKYWHTLFIENAISGLVKVRYCNAPTKLLYLAVSLGPIGVPLCHDNFSLVDNGVATGLQSAIPVFSKRSKA